MRKYKDLRKKVCLQLWEQFSKVEGSEEWNDATLDEEEFLIGMLEEYLPFKNEDQHEHWLDVLQGFKFWEDLEELTLSIINQL